MPVAKIHVLEGQYNEARLRKVSSAVQDGLISALGIPPADFFQIIHILPRGRFLHTPSFLDLNYSDALILLEITFISGRPKEKRLGLLKALNEAVVAAAAWPNAHTSRPQIQRPQAARRRNRRLTKEASMGKLEGKVTLITGGNSGIGLATAKRCVQEGAYVFITGRRDAELAAAVKEIGRNVTGVQGDVSDLGDLDRLFAQIKREKGKLDIVFANAGVATYAPFGKITEEHYDSIFDINVKGLLFTVQKALPLLSDGASVILNASIVASKGFSSNSVYSATKAAVRSFARTWTTDLKDRRIRVNAVSPGSIDTPGLSGLLG